MKLQSVLTQIAIGVDSALQFKANIKNADSLTWEMAAFANADGMALSGRADPANVLSGTEPAA